MSPAFPGSGVPGPSCTAVTVACCGDLAVLPYLQLANTFHTISAHSLALLTSAKGAATPPSVPKKLPEAPPRAFPCNEPSAYSMCAEFHVSLLSETGGEEDQVRVLHMGAGVCMHCTQIGSMDTWSKQVEFESHLHPAAQFPSCDNTGEQS